MRKVKSLGLIFLLLTACQVSKLTIAASNDTTYLALTPTLIEEKMTAKEDFIAVMGRSLCPYCNAFKGTLNTYLQTKPMPIYYYLIQEQDLPDQGITKTPTDEIQLMSLLLPTQYVPAIFFFNDGEIMRQELVGGYEVEDLDHLINRYVELS